MNSVGISIVVLVMVVLYYIAKSVMKSMRKAFPVQDDETPATNQEPFQSNSQTKTESEYFTYEDIEGNTCFTNQSTTSKKTSTRWQDESLVSEPLTDDQFDLRKAVIYSEILNRKY